MAMHRSRLLAKSGQSWQLAVKHQMLMISKMDGWEWKFRVPWFDRTCAKRLGEVPNDVSSEGGAVTASGKEANRGSDKAVDGLGWSEKPNGKQTKKLEGRRE